MVRRIVALVGGTLLAGAIAGCELTPRFVEESSEIDAFLARRAFSSACVGLKMREDDSLRTYTAEKLAELAHISVANDCLCAALYDAEAHAYDAAVAAGVQGTERDDLAECLVPAVADTNIDPEHRPELVRLLGGINARSAFSALETIATSDPSPETRAGAAETLRPCGSCVGTLVGLVQSDVSAGVRAAAARALKGRSDKKSIEVLTKAALEDADGEVRAAALDAVVQRKSAKTDDMACTAMMEDADARVRIAAVKAFHGSKRAGSIKCLEKRLLKEDENAGVRAAVLEALGASPSDRAAMVLCDAIGPFLRLYIKDKLADETPNTNIIEVQNNRDYERSYECVAKALGQGGYSCYARNHLGHWFNELGGKTSTPWCPGMARL
ncbi:MAG: HEAT repeat protein [Myxococcota bacterium]